MNCRREGHYPGELLAIARIFDHYVTGRDRNIEESNILGTFESLISNTIIKIAVRDSVWFCIYQNVFSVNGHNFRHDFQQML